MGNRMENSIVCVTVCMGEGVESALAIKIEDT